MSSSAVATEAEGSESVDDKCGSLTGKEGDCVDAMLIASKIDSLVVVW